MKCFFSVLFLLPALSFSQVTDILSEDIKSPGQHFRWEIGVNGGVNLSGAAGLDSVQSVNSFGRLYGVTIIYHFNRFIGLKTDFDYETKGFTMKGVNLGSVQGIQDVRQNLNYFDIPAFLHLGFGNRLMFDLNFGPYLGILMSEGASYTNASGELVQLATEEFTGFSKLDWGLVFGGGIDFALSKRFSLGFDFLYEKGMKVIKGDDLKNTAMIFDFGINFMLSRKK